MSLNMCSEKENASLSSKERKTFRKQKKLQHMLLAETGITPSNYPEKNVAVCNAGLATELKEEDLIRACQEYGGVDRIIMLPGKSYCFIVFCNVEIAAKAYLGIHGATNLAQGGYPLYLSYVPSVPQIASSEVTEIPEGLKLYENFVNTEEEALLLSSVNWGDQTTTGNMKHRKVKHFGYEFMYSNNNIDLKNPLKEKIPSKCDILWERLKKCENLETTPNQLTVNQYSPGQGIPSHVDTHSAFLSPILSLSLGATVVMEFRLGHKRYSQILPQRSLLIMYGAARYEWSHGITPRAYDVMGGRTYPRGERTSFTFRWVRTDATCRCNFTKQCDTFASRNIAKHSEMDNDLAALIERQHVHQVYDKIALHFNETRSKIWTSVKSFVESRPIGTFLVDIGCGNGKNLRIRRDIMQLGVEYNEALAEVAMNGDCGEVNTRTGRTQIARANCLFLPLRSQCADAVISIAVFHHLATQERRVRAISEAVRILKPRGQALITVWARDQARGEKTSYLKQSRKNRKQQNEITDVNDVITEEIKDVNGVSLNVNLPIHTNRTQFQHQDLLVPWKLKNSTANKIDNADAEESTFMRYYHVFDEGELEQDCRLVPRARVVESFYEQGNWCVILEKTCL